MLAKICFVRFLPVGDIVCFDDSPIRDRYIGEEDGFMSFSAFVELSQQVSLDSELNKVFHDADVSVSRERSIFIDHVYIYRELVYFSPQGLDPGVGHEPAPCVVVLEKRALSDPELRLKIFQGGGQCDP